MNQSSSISFYSKIKEERKENHEKYIYLSKKNNIIEINHWPLRDFLDLNSKIYEEGQLY